MFICLLEKISPQYSTRISSRGTGADLPIQSNEAMANQWMGGLINHLYLLHGHDEGDVQTLVMRVSFLGFLFQAVGPSSSKMEHSLS